LKVGELGEDEVVRRLLPHLLTDRIAIPAGADDAAAYRWEGDGFQVVSCDASVEGIHFDLGWMRAEDAGWRALALALGDLAAKGATPAYGVAMTMIPASWEVEDLVGLYRGMAELGRKTGLALVGGDTSATAGPAVIALTVLGSAAVRPLARSEAKPGWAIGVTGPLGAAALALRERRVHRPEPLLAAGRRLNEAGLCCGDISDGLLRELDKFLAYSGTGSEVRQGDVPVAEGAGPEDAMAGGEEVELVCLGPEEKVRELGLTVVGRTIAEPEVRVVDDAGRRLSPGYRGYRHFG
jgi:thiamine-monophosphate kinase